MAAGFWQANPTLSNMQVIDYLQRSASQASKPDSLMGYGIPNYAKAQEIAKNPTGLQKIQESGFSFSPNPIDNSQYLKIEFKSGFQGKNLEISLYNTTGKLVASQYLKNAPKTYNWEKLQWLKSGIYILQINTSTQSQSVKVMKR